MFVLPNKVEIALSGNAFCPPSMQKENKLCENTQDKYIRIFILNKNWKWLMKCILLDISYNICMEGMLIVKKGSCGEPASYGILKQCLGRLGVLVLKVSVLSDIVTTNFVQAPPTTKKKSGRRKKHRNHSDTSDSERGRKRSRADASPLEEDVSSSLESPEGYKWGTQVPREVLFKVFSIVCAQDGCLPALVR